jgi:signal transduction histidine kinase
LATLGIEDADVALSTEAPPSERTSSVSISTSAERDLFATTVHELRSPLTTISGQVQLARRFVAKDPAREREALSVALAQVARIDRLLDELADLSRATSSESPLDDVIFDLRDMVADAITRHETDDAPRFTVRSPDERVDVRGDGGKIARILDNLLDNAVKYSPASAPIDVSLLVIGDEAVVTVEDRGVGIPADAQDHLFSPYFRTVRTREIPGTGLGLHISRCVAEQHGGRLWLERSTETGSTFALALPLAVGRPPSTTAPS